MNLGDRMKGYEDVMRFKLIRRMPVIIRIDGRAFHTFTRSFDKPWDAKLQGVMIRAAVALIDAVQGARLAYIQSDEISLLVVDYNKFDSEPWFDGNLQKMVSVAAAVATAAFSVYKHCPTFDARAFNLPREEVVNYFIWRQQDAVRNSIQSLAQAHFPHKELQGLNTSELQDLLMTSEINWNDIATHNKRGWCVLAKAEGIGIDCRGVDWNIPIFSQQRDYIQTLVDRVEDE